MLQDKKKVSSTNKVQERKKRDGGRKEPIYEKKPKQHHPRVLWGPYFDPDLKNLKILSNQGNLNTYWLFYKHLL